MHSKQNPNPSQIDVKINYLQEENKLLKERIQDLEEIIKLNKKAFERSVALEAHSKQESLKNLKSITSTKTIDEQLKFYKSIGDELTKENTHLNLKLEKLMKERDLAKDKVFENLLNIYLFTIFFVENL